MNSGYLIVGAAVVAMACGSGTRVLAQDKSAEIQKIFQAMSASEPGCSVAVMQEGKVIARAAVGAADLERGSAISPDSVFDAGSVTKQFVAAAILILVEEGKLSLTEDIRTYIPEMPDCGHRVTLDHLLTHTSGVRDWTGIVPLSAGDPDALTVVLRQRGLNFAPGEEMSYSNSGYVLLKEIVARTSGKTFSEFTQVKLFEPLGMKSTRYVANLREVIPGRALAYENVRGKWEMAMKLDNADRGGGGALFSHPSDLLVWNEALTSRKLGPFVTGKLQESAKLNSGRAIGYGCGLFLGTYRGAKEIWHSGGAGGYGTWLGRYPEKGISIAIMCNGEGAEPGQLAHRIFDLLASDLGPVEAGSGPPPAIPEAILADVSARAGLYFNDKTGESMRLAVDRGRFRLAGGPGLVASDKDTFRRFGNSLQFMSGDEFELRFVSADEFDLKSMDGGAARYRRAQTFAPSAAELAAFGGKYKSDEMGAVFCIEPKGNGLRAWLEQSPERPLEFRPVDRDTFQLGRVTLRFCREKAGTVTSLEYSNPVVRKVVFTRTADVGKPAGGK